MRAARFVGRLFEATARDPGPACPGAEARWAAALSGGRAFRRVPVMRAPTRFLPPLLLALPALLATAPARADLAPIGLSEVGAQWFDNEDLVFYGPEVGDHFAAALAAGDFNGDGADDLATGIPDDDEIGGGCTDCGMVVIRYGGEGGLAGGLATTVLHQGLAGSPRDAFEGNRFGAALAAGDFNHDLYDDLAVGVPGNGGVVQIYYGSPSGLQTDNAQVLYHYLAYFNYCDGIDFGAALAVGDFDHDLYADLVVGAPNDCVENEEDEDIRSGVVYVAHGHELGLVPFDGYWISQDSPGIADEIEEGDQFGRAVAAGDFNADTFDDLAIGVAAEGTNGAIEIVMGSEFGLIFANSVFWEPGALGEVPEDGDRLGFSLASGDFDADGYADLAIGNPSEDLGAANEKFDAGSIVVAYGAPAWFDLSRTQRFAQGNVYDNAAYDQSEDQFGWALAAGDFDGDGADDLAVGHPREHVLAARAGAITVLMGAPIAGLVSRFRFVAAGLVGLPGDTQGYQEFGHALAVGDFDGTGFADLVIGAPLFSRDGIADVGGEMVLYGALFADGFEIGSTQRW